MEHKETDIVGVRYNRVTQCVDCWDTFWDIFGNKPEQGIEDMLPLPPEGAPLFLRAENVGDDTCHTCGGALDRE